MASPGINSVVQHLWHWAAGQSTVGASDQQLLERFVTSREEGAFTALVNRHGAMVFGVCRRLLRETHDAEDAFQATFLVLARKAAAIHKRESLGSWLHGVAVRVAHGSRRAAGRRSRLERERPAPATVEASDRITWGELRSVLDEELSRLPAQVRSPLVLCYLEGQTQDEAARRLGWSKSTFRRRLERGRALLQSRLARRGVTLSAGLLAPFLCEPAASAAAAKVLTASTVKTALLFGAGQSIGPVMTPSGALAETVLKSMLLAKGKLAASVMLTLTMLAGVGLWAYHAAAQKRTGITAPVPASISNRREGKPFQDPQVAVDQFGDRLPAGALARLGTIRLQHGSVAWALTFAPDGRSLASAGHDGVVHIWETASGKELVRIENERFPGGLGAVFSLSYAPDGKTLAGARINQPVCLWDVATGQEVRQFGGDDWRTNRANWVVVSPNGKTLAYGGGKEDPSIRLADVSTGRDLARFERHSGYAVRAAYSPDGETLAAAEEQSIHLFEVATGKRRELALTDGAAASVTGLAYSRDGKTLAATSHANKLIRLVDVVTGKVLRIITLPGKRKEARSILFARDDETLISGHEDGSVRFWDAATGKRTRQFRA
ncbi:MAG TPA: sigma-70 family RNA polymerase sigma factor, partial [Gemmataceae bacterium]|nr:sigma-70 family RNA polymerase sigma factor [Gemmataceae bacterium]